MTEAEAEQLRRENQELREKVASFEEKLEAALVDTAMRDAALHPRREEVYAAIERDQRIRREKRRGLRRLPIGAKSLGAYLIAAGVLLLWSYVTRYTL